MGMKNVSPSGFDDYVASDQLRLQRLAYALTGDRSDAEDLVQETLVRMLLAWPRLDERGPHAYAYTVMCRLARRRMRARRNLPWRESSAGPETPDVETRITLESAIRGLPRGQRAVLALRYLCDQSEVATAAILDCSVGTVKSQRSKAIRTLADRLNVSDPNQNVPASGTLAKEASHDI